MAQAHHRLLEAIDACHACQEIDAWPDVALAELHRLIPCDVAAFNDFDPEAGRYVARTLPDSRPPDGWEEVWGRYGEQNLAYRQLIQRGDVGPLRLSDFLTQRQLRATELYRELYRHLGVRYQIGMALEAPTPQITAFALNRTARDFTNREVELARLIRPHLRRAYDNARARAGIERDRARMAAAAETSNVRVVRLDRHALILDATPPAASLLERHLTAPVAGATLAPPLAGWVAAEIGSQEPASAAFRTPAGILGASLVPGADGALVLLEEQFARGSDSLPLTARERQVLEAIAGGATNAEAAAKLDVREGTIAKHLEHVYEKLGVRNRGAALAFYAQAERVRAPSHPE